MCIIGLSWLHFAAPDYWKVIPFEWFIFFFWNLYLDSTSKEGRRLRSAPPEGMHALHREREGHLFLGLQFSPCCWVRWVMISLIPLHFLEILNYNFCFVLMNCILGGLFDLEISHTHTHTHARAHAQVGPVELFICSWQLLIRFHCNLTFFLSY